jgi:hypothetical protein
MRNDVIICGDGIMSYVTYVSSPKIFFTGLDWI